MKTMKKDTSVIRFFESHRWLLSDPRFEQEANRRLGAARRHLAATQAKAARARARLALQKRAAAHRRHELQLARSP